MLSQPSAGTTSLTITLGNDAQVSGMTYQSTYQVKLYPVNQCGLGYNPTSVVVATKPAPSAPLIANPPVNSILTAAQIKTSWTAIGTSEDETGGYPVTSY